MFGIKIFHDDNNDNNSAWADELMSIAATGYDCTMGGDYEWTPYSDGTFTDDNFVEMRFLNEGDRDTFVKFLKKYYPTYSIELFVRN